MQENLLPDLHHIIKKTNTPKEILEDQSAFLADATENTAYFSVEKHTKDLFEATTQHFSNSLKTLTSSDTDNTFKFDFFVKSKYMTDYKFKIFSFEHKISMYPLNISLDTDIGEEIESELRDDLYSKIQKSDSKFLIYGVKDEACFKEILRIIFRSHYFVEIIQSIFNLSR